jgi:hypothetical protein
MIYTLWIVSAMNDRLNRHAIVSSQHLSQNKPVERSARRTTERHHHATATKLTGTSVLDCDGGTASVSASLLNICNICDT